MIEAGGAIAARCGHEHPRRLHDRSHIIMHVRSPKSAGWTSARRRCRGLRRSLQEVTMALTSYACFEGQKRGVMEVPPSFDMAGGKRRASPWVVLESYELHPEVPFESKPSKLKGVRAKYPLVITQEFGPISLWLEEAAREAEVLSAVIIETVSVDRHGFEHVEQRITLSDVLIRDVRAHTGSAAASGRVLNDFSFTFQGISILGEEVE